MQQALGRLGWPVRWVTPDRCHITLKFFGDTPRADVADLTGRVADVASRSRPLRLRTAGLGAFPTPTRPRVIWVGLQGDVSELERLAQNVDAATGGTRSESFRPHITLGRVREGAESISNFAGAVERLKHDAVEFGVDSIDVIRSVLGPGGPTYTTLATLPLGRPEQHEHG